LVGGTLLFFLATAYLAYLLGGWDMVVFSAVAAGLCLVPTTATLVWTERTRRSAPEMQLLAVMGGTLVRMVFVIGMAMALYQTREYFHRQSFWIWVVVYYLVTLTLEMSLIVSRTENRGERET
jgi:hypothetical protein